MAEPRLPEPLTPDRAEKLAVRWWWAAIGAVVVGAVVGWAGVPNAAMAGVAIATVCLSMRSGYAGWRRGYLDREREELRRRAGELR